MCRFATRTLSAPRPHHTQVRKLRVEHNEELQLRQALKNMESRRGSAEQCSSIRMAVVGKRWKQHGPWPHNLVNLFLYACWSGLHPRRGPTLSPDRVLAGEPGSGGGVVQALRALEVQLSLIMKQELQMAAGEDGSGGAVAKEREAQASAQNSAERLLVRACHAPAEAV